MYMVKMRYFPPSFYLNLVRCSRDLYLVLFEICFFPPKLAVFSEEQSEKEILLNNSFPSLYILGVRAD